MHSYRLVRFSVPFCSAAFRSCAFFFFSITSRDEPLPSYTVGYLLLPSVTFHYLPGMFYYFSFCYLPLPSVTFHSVPLPSVPLSFFFCRPVPFSSAAFCHLLFCFDPFQSFGTFYFYAVPYHNRSVTSRAFCSVPLSFVTSHSCSVPSRAIPLP